ncbi:MAG TPA: hypothetical protein VF310_02190, partial [Vicinamibacteria bacterium]
MMLSPKPFVQTACVCEKVLIEPDQVVSLIRIVDTYVIYLPPNTPAPPPGVGLDLTAFVGLKSGDAVGRFDVGLRIQDPDGESKPIRHWPIVLNGG